MKRIRIQQDRFVHLEQCAALMGLSVEACIDEALYDYLIAAATARISQFEKPNNVINIENWKTRRDACG